MALTTLYYGQTNYVEATNANNAYLESIAGGGGGGGGTIVGVNATSPLTASGTTTRTLAIPAATNSVNGYLTSTDWTTFNSKKDGSYVPTWAEITGKPSFATVATTGAYADLSGKPTAYSQSAYDETSTLLSSAVVSYNFTGAGVTATHTGGGAITVNIPGGGGASSIEVQDEGTSKTTALSILNFVGAGVAVTNTGGNCTVTISGSAGIATTDDLTQGSTNKYYSDSLVRACVLTGVSFATGTAITATDTVLTGMGKLQKQVTDNLGTFTSHAGSGGGAHANVVAAGASGFMTGSDKTKLDGITGTNTGDETTATIKSKLGISTLSGSNTGDQNTFSTITISGQSDVVADSATDTLTLVAGTGITLTTNAATDTITITASGGGGSAITVQDETSNITTALSTLNFVGAGVTASNSSGTVTVTIPQDLTALTGDVTASGSGSQVATIQPNVVTLAKFQQIATASFLGRSTAATGNIEILSASGAKTVLSLNNVENTALSTWAGSTNLVTIGAATATSINKVTITAPATSATLTIANGKTFTASNTVTITATDGSTLAIGTGGTLGTAAYTASTSYAPAAGSTSIVTLGTVTAATWNATVISGQYGGTGVANTGKTITVGGNFTTSGAFATTFTMTATTTVTFPTTGTLATLAGSETFTNKTLTTPTISGFVETGATATGSSFSPDITSTTDFEYTTNANATLTLPTPIAGKSYTIAIIYGGAHTLTISGGTTIKYVGGSPYPVTGVSGKIDYYVCKCNRAGTETHVFDGGRGL